MKKILSLAVLLSLLICTSANAKTNQDYIIEALKKVNNLDRSHITFISEINADNKKLKSSLNTKHITEFYFDNASSSSKKLHVAEAFYIKSSDPKNSTFKSNTLYEVVDGNRYDYVFGSSAENSSWYKSKSTDSDFDFANLFMKDKMAMSVEKPQKNSGFVYNFLSTYKNDISIKKLSNQKIAGKDALHYKLVLKNKSFYKFAKDYLTYFYDKSQEAALAPLALKSDYKINSVNFDIWLDKKTNDPLRFVFALVAVGEDKKNKANGKVLLNSKHTIDFTSLQVSKAKSEEDLNNNLSAPINYINNSQL